MPWFFFFFSLPLFARSLTGPDLCTGHTGGDTVSARALSPRRSLCPHSPAVTKINITFRKQHVKDLPVVFWVIAIMSALYYATFYSFIAFSKCASNCPDRPSLSTGPS